MNDTKTSWEKNEVLTSSKSIKACSNQTGNIFLRMFSLIEAVDLRIPTPLEKTSTTTLSHKTAAAFRSVGSRRSNTCPAGGLVWGKKDPTNHMECQRGTLLQTNPAHWLVVMTSFETSVFFREGQEKKMLNFISAHPQLIPSFHFLPFGTFWCPFIRAKSCMQDGVTQEHPATPGCKPHVRLIRPSSSFISSLFK